MIHYSVLSAVQIRGTMKLYGVENGNLGPRVTLLTVCHWTLLKRKAKPYFAVRLYWCAHTREGDAARGHISTSHAL